MAQRTLAGKLKNWVVSHNCIFAGLSGSIITLVGNYLNKRQEAKTAIKLSILDNAFKEYELRTKMMEGFADKDKTVRFYPWDMYVLSYSKVLNLLDKKDIKKRRC